MSIEELPDPGNGLRPDGSPWTATVLTLSAGVLLGVVLMWAIGPQANPAPSSAPGRSADVARASGSPSGPRPTPIPADIIGTGLIASARHSLQVDRIRFSFSVPADGWVRYGRLYISKSARGPQGAEAMIFWARHPAGSDARACGFPPAKPIGYTAAQVAENLATGLRGTELVSGPTDVTVGGLPAKQVVLFVRDTDWCGPGFFYTWDGEESRGGPMWGSPLLGDTITIWVLDLQEQRFVIAAETHLNAGAELEAEVQQIVDSIQFEEPDPTGGAFALGRHSTTVDSTAFSFAIGSGGWEPYQTEAGPLASTLISKSTEGSQGAEEVIYWAGYFRSLDHVPCGVLQNPADPPTALDVARRVASAPGTDLVTGPRHVAVGGRPAVQVVVRVRAALGCDPGFFYSWIPQRFGALWTETKVGDTIRVWVVEVDAGLLFIGAITTADTTGRDQEIQRIVDSIEFE